MKIQTQMQTNIKALLNITTFDFLTEFIYYYFTVYLHVNRRLIINNNYSLKAK